MNDMTNDRPFRDAARRAEYDAMSLEERVDMLAKDRWPDMFRRVPPPPPDPLDDLLEPAPSGMSKHDLEARFNALARGVFDNREQLNEAYADYMTDSGRNLPPRYRDPETGRIIDTKSGEDITDEVEFTKEASGIRDQIRHFTRVARDEDEMGNEGAAASAREQAEEAADDLARCYQKHGKPLSEQMQERLADA